MFGYNKQVVSSTQSQYDNRVWFTCVSNVMPFSSIDNNEVIPDLQIKSNLLLNSKPSFNIQSLLDQMPGQNFETGEFMSDTISSKYFTPSEFLENKLPSNEFPILNINISRR